MSRNAKTSWSYTKLPIFLHFRKVTHVKKARNIHQVTAAALYHLLLDSHHESNTELELEAWCRKRAEESVMFKYWLTCIHMEIILLRFVRSIREANYSMYRDSLKETMPWFFLLDHHNYSRWLPIHLKDIFDVEIKLPDVSHAFPSGRFSFSSSLLAFPIYLGSALLT